MGSPPPPAPPPASFESCLRIDRRAGDGFRPIWLGRFKVQPKGALLRAASASWELQKDLHVAFGVLGDTREALPATLEQVERYAEQFSRAGATAIILLGGIDASFEGTRAVLDRLQAAAPVLALPGDRASRAGFQAAAEAFPTKVIDLVRFRAVALPPVTLIGIPGYHLPHHLIAKEQGCSYSEKDLRSLSTMITSLPLPRVLLAHGPPRGSGPLAVDRALGDVNIGDPLLARLFSSEKQAIRFGLFAHVHESAGHATTSKGRPVPPMTWSRSLLLNVGSADSVPHQDLKGRWSAGTAAIVEFKAGQARYRMLSSYRKRPRGTEKKNEN